MKAPASIVAASLTLPQSAVPARMLIDTGAQFEAGLDHRLIKTAGLEPLEKTAEIQGLGGGESKGRVLLGDLSLFTFADEPLQPDVEVVELPALAEPDINGVIGMGLLRHAVFFLNGRAETFTLAW
jgi:predicted aspartyl protease